MERRRSVLRDLSRIKGRGHIKQDTLFMACVSHFSRSFHRFNLNFELWTWFANWRRFSAVDTAGLISSHFHDYNKKMRFLMVRRLWLSGVLPAHLLVRPCQPFGWIGKGRKSKTTSSLSSKRSNSVNLYRNKCIQTSRENLCVESRTHCIQYLYHIYIYLLNRSFL